MRENLLHGVWLSFSILRNGEGHLQLCCWAVSKGSEQETRSLPLSFDDSSSWFCTFGSKPPDRRKQVASSQGHKFMGSLWAWPVARSSASFIQETPE